ncbi:MAG: Asp23/Gls24 family envelope stress response protein [Candidatus Omnitrophica bacterium]|nr:Asp23/Gls24 family envelope stress response protein [Candidatus Omnitrophota bacterium]
MARQTDLGSVQIRNDVIASIAALAAREVEGVLGIWQSPFWLRPFPEGAGVRVETHDQEVRLWVNLVAEYGVNLPQVALEVQDRVREMVEQMTHLTAVEVHVSIHQIKPRRS